MKKYLMMLLVVLVSCQETERSVPVPGDDAAPPSVSNIQVDNIPGGAVLTYTLPKSESLLYVLAEYSIHEGDSLEKKSSYYNNSITLEGFPDTSMYTIKLYAVSRGGKKSAPLDVTIHPLTPPVITVFKSLTMEPTFGGVYVTFKNEDEANIKISVITPDSFGYLYPAETYYTKRKDGGFSARGFDSVDRKFGVFVRDRWDNYSDTLFADLKPLYEKQLDKSKFKEVHLSNDTYVQHCCGDGMVNIWDGVWDANQPVFHTKPGTGMPQWFTFDLGTTARLSRFKFYHRLAGSNGAGTDGQYNSGDPKVLEVYGSNDPATDGSWDSWTLLGHFQSIMPSGGPTPTAEDIQYACVNGEDFDLPPDAPPFRYLRIKILDTWGGVDYMYMSELTFWGQE